MTDEEGTQQLRQILKLKSQIRKEATEAKKNKVSEDEAHQIDRQAVQACDALDRMSYWIGRSCGLVRASQAPEESPIHLGFVGASYKL